MPIARYFLISCLAFALPAAADEPAEDTGEHVHVLKGDKWVYEDFDDITGEKKYELTYVVTEDSGQEIVVNATNGKGNDFMIFDNDWDMVKDNVWRQKPHDATGVKLPLSVGKEWRTTHIVQHLKSGTARSASSDTKVVAKESVTTKAGTFDTFKVVTVEERPAMQDPTSHDRFTVTTWYAPAVKRWVKRTFEQKTDGHLANAYSLLLSSYSVK